MAQSNEWRRAAKAFYRNSPSQVVNSEIIRPGRYESGDPRMGVPEANDLGCVKDPAFDSPQGRAYRLAQRTDDKINVAPAWPVAYIE